MALALAGFGFKTGFALLSTGFGFDWAWLPGPLKQNIYHKTYTMKHLGAWISQQHTATKYIPGSRRLAPEPNRKYASLVEST